MAIFNSYANVYQRVSFFTCHWFHKDVQLRRWYISSHSTDSGPTSLSRADVQILNTDQSHSPSSPHFVRWFFLQDSDQDFLCLVTGFWTQGRQLQREKFWVQEPRWCHRGHCWQRRPSAAGRTPFFSDSGYSHSKLLSSNSQKRWKRAANCLSIVIVQDVQACCKTRRMRIMRIFHQHFPALSGLFRCPCNNGQATTRQMRRTESWNAKAAVGCWGKDWSQSKSTANSFVLVENFGWELTWHIQVPSKWVAVIGAKVCKSVIPMTHVAA